ncbi:MAG: acetyl-CoA carboxylase subunit beta [Elusimicrobia bacterium RIFOXYA2_FULL_39_19]|nr:MAG: acetyl-CoA carboxylase subunit beta [Elusimicrobia bacterium RIFOXYA2_FULL_39_19]
MPKKDSSLKKVKETTPESAPAVKPAEKPAAAPHGLWVKCKPCEHIIYTKELIANAKICPKCGYYFRMTARERISLLTEPESFKEYDVEMKSVNRLNFPDYTKRYEGARKKMSMNECLVSGEAMLGEHKIVICVLDFDFMGGSMGSVCGEKITRAVEKAIKKECPVIIVSASGGARMQEGIFSLMQMAKTSAALAELSKAGLPFISIMVDPTTGGVTASFAMLGDINMAEPKALIGFAGPRVIEQTIREKLPAGFQLSEFVQNHGMIDIIVTRKEMKSTLNKLLTFLDYTKAANK